MYEAYAATHFIASVGDNFRHEVKVWKQQGCSSTED